MHPTDRKLGINASVRVSNNKIYSLELIKNQYGLSWCEEGRGYVHQVISCKSLNVGAAIEEVKHYFAKYKDSLIIDDRR
jgi:hypothetical protein